MNIDRIILILITISVVYLLFFKKEHMTADNTTKQLIMDHYKIDVDAIRNLSKLANDLTQTGKLRVPGGLEIDGKLTVKGESILENKVNVNNELAVKSKAGAITHFNHANSGKHFINGTALEVNTISAFHKDIVAHKTSTFNSTSTFNGPTNFKNQKTGAVSHLNQPDGNIYLRGSVIMDGSGGSGSTFTNHGNTVLNGNTNINGNIDNIKLFYRFHMRVNEPPTIIKYGDITFDDKWVCVIAGFANRWHDNSDGSGGSSVSTFLDKSSNKWFAHTKSRHRGSTNGNEVTILAFKKGTMLVNSDPYRNIHFHD